MKIAEQWKKRLSILLILIMCIVNGNVLPVSAKTTIQKPIILTNTITNATTSLQVYGTKGATLYIKNGTKTLAKKKFKKESVQTITIKVQKAGSTLKFYLQDGKGKSSAVKKTVKKLSSQSESKKLKKPVISATVRSTDTKLKVRGYKGTKLYIKNDSNKVVKTAKYTKDEVKTVKIQKQKSTQTLYFYLVKGKNRSAIVRKTVKDVTAPEKPTITEKSSGSLLVKGEVGSTVYVKYGTNSSYVDKCILASKSGIIISGLQPDSMGYYYVKLKDVSGNNSAETKLKSKYFVGKSDEEESEEEESSQIPENEVASEYSYKVTPLLMPFNKYFYVQTDDPNPSDIRLVDKESVYYTGESEPAYLFPTKTRFMDVSYEDKTKGKVKGGYIFTTNDIRLDGGVLTVQREVGGKYQDTKSQVSCVSVKASDQYLIDTYTSPEKGFFENMDAVQKALDSLALYPRSTKDINQKSEYYPYPALAVSPYRELSLNDHYEMYKTAEEYLLLNSLYPFILDSLGVPSTMASIAKKLDSSCQTQWGSSHSVVEVIKDGETHYYGGAGKGTSDPLYSNRVEKLFLFDHSEQDYAWNATLDKLSEKRMEYGQYAAEDAAYYKDLIDGATYSKTVGLGSWIRVATEGSAAKSYAYVTHGCVYMDDGKDTPCSVENVWVDGRYIDKWNKYVPGAKISDFPTADIMIRDMDYINKWGQKRHGDITYEYDEKSGCWLSRAYVSVSSYQWLLFTIEDLPEEMILTPEQVEAMQVDRNTEIVPPGLIYDGTAFPGTPYE